MKENSDIQALAQELGRKRKFQTPQEAAVLAVLRAAALLRRALARPFSAAGLTMAQYNVLRILRGAPEGLPTLQIRSRMLEQGAGVTRLVDKLCEEGFVARIQSAEDRRQVLCRITPKGLRRLEEQEHAIDWAHSSLASTLSDDEAHRLVRLAMKLITHLHSHL